jgi:UDP-N-acetylmuramate--alanine ligase
MTHVHFIGIGGSGISSVAQIALARGYRISGCDFNPQSKYTTGLYAQNVPMHTGHDVAHLQGADIVAASPAAIDAPSPHPEIVRAREMGVLVTWQQFLGEHLMKDQYPLAVAGTHGKTTTTAMLGLTLEAGGLDPTVFVGGRLVDWGSNARVGKSKYFVCEADEFNYNFIHYSPRLAILNNVEFEHPEYFDGEESYFRAFCDFITTMPDGSVLIANLGDAGVVRVLSQTRHFIRSHGLRIVGVGLSRVNNLFSDETLSATVRSVDGKGTLFDVSGIVDAGDIRLSALGRHNVNNAVAVVAAAHLLGLGLDPVRVALKKFSGVDRRLQTIFANDRLHVYDDYGHHPTEIGATLKAVKDHFPTQRIIAVVEPHMVSRINLFYQQYADALAIADKVYFTKAFLGREMGKGVPNLQRLVETIGKPKADLHFEFEETAAAVAGGDTDNSVIVVFGAGNSPNLTRQIVESVKSKA